MRSPHWQYPSSHLSILHVHHTGLRSYSLTTLRRLVMEVGSISILVCNLNYSRSRSHTSKCLLVLGESVKPWCILANTLVLAISSVKLRKGKFVSSKRIGPYEPHPNHSTNLTLQHFITFWTAKQILFLLRSPWLAQKNKISSLYEQGKYSGPISTWLNSTPKKHGIGRTKLYYKQIYPEVLGLRLTNSYLFPT